MDMLITGNKNVEIIMYTDPSFAGYIFVVMLDTEGLEDPQTFSILALDLDALLERYHAYKENRKIEF